MESRGKKAVQLAEAMIDDAKAVTAKEALDAGLIDFISDDTEDLLQSLDGFTVQMEDSRHTFKTENIRTENLGISFIEQLLLLLTDPNIAFLLLAIGVQAVLIEISSPGGWVAGFIGAVCLTLAVYGMGVLSVNWFGCQPHYARLSLKLKIKAIALAKTWCLFSKKSKENGILVM